MKKYLFIFIVFSLFVISAQNTIAAESFYCKCSSGSTLISCHGNFDTLYAFTSEPSCVGCVGIAGDIASDAECEALLTTNNTTAAANTSATSKTKIPTSTRLDNPLEGNITDINSIVGNIIKTVLGVMGAFVLLMIVYGGFTWLTAAGSPEKVKSGANTIMWAVLGAVVVLGSYFLLTTVLGILAGK